MRVGIDVGGTFTDLVLWDGQTVRTAKVPTTPDDQSQGVEAALDLSGAEGAALLHGTTVATNALLERRGARTVLVTDAGFEHLLEIGRQDRPSLYDVTVTRPAPLVPRAMRMGLAGRSGDGTVPSDAELRQVVARVAELEPDAIAVSTLFAFSDPAREDAVAAVLEAHLPTLSLALSSRVAPEFREFERTSTTVINAYLMPVVGRYLGRLGEVARRTGLVGEPMVMRSSGGLIDLAAASDFPASVVLSGPAGGAVAAGALGRALGADSVISFDMGGTSTDVCRIDGGRPEVRYEQSVGGLPNRMPAVAVHTVGAGGGSMAWVDPGGALRVGPRSAGAVPGPAAYGRSGSEPTVTDADLVLGRIGTGTVLGESVRLDAGAARRSLEHLGERLGLNPGAIAAGIVEVVEAHMERAIRVVSVEQGVDARGSILVAFGGAGGLHATALARRLGMYSVVVPPHAGVFSALGLLLAPPRSDAVVGRFLTEGEAATLESLLRQVRAEAADRLGVSGGAATIESTADVRYRGQSHELGVPLESGEGWSVLRQRFDAAHLARNGFSLPEAPIEVVAVRAAALGEPVLRFGELPPVAPHGDPRRGSRSVLHGGTQTEAAVWWRPALAPGTEVSGPAVVEEPGATTFLAFGERAVVHDTGSLEVTW